MDAIVSVTSDWAIGKDGGLLVPNKADMRRFVQLTRGCTVLMGRKTLESFPGGPLKGRRNVVVSRREGYAPEGVEVFSTPEAALAATSGDEKVWLIGGASVYQALIRQVRASLRHRGRMRARGGLVVSQPGREPGLGRSRPAGRGASPRPACRLSL